MIRAITSFKPNSTNAIFSNKCCGTSQPNFKGAEQDCAEAFTRALGKYTETRAIEMTFLDLVGEAALESEKAARSFVARFRNKVLGLSNEKIDKAIQEGVDFKSSQRNYHEGF